jgi:hypothetical protein
MKCVVLLAILLGVESLMYVQSKSGGWPGECCLETQWTIGSTGASDCGQCPAGKWADMSVGATVCAPAAGQTAPPPPTPSWVGNMGFAATMYECRNCPTGKYQPTEKMTGCDVGQAATGNFCQNQANYVPTATAGHPGAAADTDACSSAMATYETAGSITDWETRFAPAGRVAACATVVAGNAFSVHLDAKARNCCTGGKHICDVAQGNLCKDQTTFSPTALAKDGTTCMAKELEYEAAGLFDIASWTTVYAAGECASKTFGGYALKVHLDDQTAACCTSGGNVCAAPAPTTTAITTAGPTTAGWRCPEGQYYKVAAGSFTCPQCPKDTYWVGYAENLAYGDLECAECPDQHASPEGSIGSSACIDQSPASVTLIVLAIILPALFVILWASCAYKKGLFRNQRGGQHPSAPSLTHAHTSLAPLRRQGKRAGAQGVANRVLGHLRRPIHLCGRHVLSMLSVLRCNG